VAIAEWSAVLLFAFAVQDPSKSAPKDPSDRAPQDQVKASTKDRSVLRIGQWVKVKGALDPSGVFVAEEIEVVPPDDKEVLVGRVEKVLDRERFELLGQRVRTSDKTEWKELEIGDLPGTRVRVKGVWRGGGNFSSREISKRGEGRDGIEGRIDRLELDGPFLRLTIMGFRVQVAEKVDVEHAQPLDQIPLAPELVLNPRGLQRDEEDEVLGSVQLLDDLTLGGQIELEWTRKDNRDLDDAKAADRTDYDLSARLEMVWEPSQDFFALLNARMTQQWRHDEADGQSHADDVILAEAFGYWRDALGWGWDVQVGRQDFDEKREWLYDENLDAVRLIHSQPSWRLELSAATKLSDGSERDENSTDLIAYLSNNSHSKHAALYAIDRRDQDDSGEHFTHLGGRMYGEWLPQSQSWLELAGLLGQSGGEDLGALGFDLGNTWIPEADWAPALTTAWAWGSGDQEPGSGNNGTFRQTGFQDNNDKWSGVTSFRYYGELVDPELANLSIVTFGLGKRLTRNNSLDLVWHRYDQVEPADALINTDLRDQPDGIHTYLGWETDLVFGSRSIRNTQIECVVGWFEPGDAFPDGDPAWLGRVQLRWRF
jgi:alginate production protein